MAEEPPKKDSHQQKEMKIVLKGSDGIKKQEIVLHPTDDGKFPPIVEITNMVSTIKPEGEPSHADEKGIVIQADVLPLRRYRIYEIFQQVLTLISSAMIVAILGVTLQKYQSTKDVAGAWPDQPLLYPTIVLLSMASLTLLVDLIHLAARFLTPKYAARAEFAVTKLRFAMSVFQALASGTGAGVFQYVNTNGEQNDLWGWSCSVNADKMANVNNADMICKSNTGVSALAVLNTVLQVITLLLMLSKMFAPKQPEQAYEKVKDDDKGKKEGEKGESASEKLDLEQVLEAAKQGQVVYSSITKLE